VQPPRRMRKLREDLRFGVRLLARTPGFTAAALVMLALGIGVNTALLSFVDAIFLRPLDVPHASRLVHVYQTRNGSGAYPLSLPDYVYFKQHARSLEDAAAHYPSAPLHIIAAGEPHALIGSVVTASYFNVLGIRPALGRFFTEEEDRVPGRDAVVVVGHAFWRQRLGGDPQALGQTIAINGRPFSIVGVAPPGFTSTLQGLSTSHVWIPSAMFHLGYRYCDAFRQDCTIVQIIARLKPGASLDAARAELNLLSRQIEEAYPDNTGLGALVVPARGSYPAEQEASVPLTGLLLASVAMVLVVACANVAGLLLVRGVKRRREIAIRLALGASRLRVVRQLLTEAALLAIAGSALGLIVAIWANETLQSFYAVNYAGIPLQFELGIRPWVAAVTGGLAILTAVLCGLAPALLGSAPDVLGALKDETGTGGRRRSFLRDGLVVLQVACSMMLLVGAGLLIRSLQDISRGPGIDASRVVMVRLRPSLVGYDGGKARAFQREVIRRLESLPGVEAASAGESLPMFGGGGRVAIELRSASGAAAQTVRAIGSRIGDRYFEVLGQPVLEGREFDARDREAARRVAVVNDVLARQLWPGESTAGRTVYIDGLPHDVIGVVRAAQYHTIAEQPVPYVYLNYWQQDARGGWAADSRTHIRVRGDASAMMPAIRREIASVDRAVPLSEDYSLDTRIAFTFRRVRMTMTMLLSFGATAVVLSAIGLYGIVAFAISLRTREIAIRMALGARPEQVRSLVIGHGIRIALVGGIIGLVGASAGARLLATMLHGVQPHDLATFTAVAVALLAVTLIASGIPARRAMRVDPALALRQE
jgi:predicted permease